MALNKTPVTINFNQGLDTKSDPKQVPIGKFLGLKNSVFGKNGALTKRNGYALLSTTPTVPDYITTLNGNLTGVGSTILAYSEPQDTWLSKGTIDPIDLSTLPLIHNSVNHTQSDAAISSNGLVCTVYTEVNAGASVYRYAVADAATGQNIRAPSPIPVTTGTVTGSPRVFILGTYFIIVFTNVITATSHLQYVAISILDPTRVTANADIAPAYTAATTVAWDGIVYGTNLYLSYYTTAGGNAVKATYLSVHQAAIGGAPVTPVTLDTLAAREFALAVDSTVPGNPAIYITWFESNDGKVAIIDQNLAVLRASTITYTGANPTYIPVNLAIVAQAGVGTIYFEIPINYSFDASIPSHYIIKQTVPLAGALTPPSGSDITNPAVTPVVLRSVGLASKAILVGSKPYFMAVYQSPYQSTYFLVRGDSLEASPKVIAKLAYQNARGYLTTGVPSLSNIDGVLTAPYLVTDLITSVNKGTAVPSGTQTAGIYTQFGINLVRFEVDTQKIYSAEITSNLHITGGFLWQYDGYLPVEHGFHLYPSSIKATWSATGGSMKAQPDGVTNTNAYYYQVTYEWSDNQGNIYRSAPSIPVAVTTTGALSTGSVVLNIPTLRLTYKTANPIKIVIYRWSVAQQAYYQVTSISSATLNSTTADSVAFTDTLADATILGNSLIYTTGGVVENVAPSAVSAVTLFDNRLWVIDAENRNNIAFSKQIIQSTPVEMSDLFTLYIAPTTGAQGPGTGPSSAICGMDDKLIIFKDNAIYYINGTGPDITGANSQYSQPTFITAAVGTDNPDSVCLIPTGIMFESNKGIWLLGRDLSTKYIGSPVERYNGDRVLSVTSAPGTTQVRFRLASGLVLMYDYFYDQWGTFTGVPGISSVVYNELDTFINVYGQVLQETPNLYLDNTKPVLLGFTTSWLSLAGLQGFERFYHGFLLGTYVTPFKLNMELAYDYNSNASQSIEILPDNYSPVYGDDPLYGSGDPYGGPSNVFEVRFFPEVQKCETFQVTMTEVYDGTYGVAAGAGLSLSGITLMVGVKKGSRTQKASQSFG
jgi:hypothetical protein